MSGQGKESDFENEARERLATAEADLDTLDEKVDSLADGQEQIMDKLDDLDDRFVEEEEFEDVAEDVSKNSNARVRVRTAALTLVKAAAIIGGGSGYVLYFL